MSEYTLTTKRLGLKLLSRDDIRYLEILDSDPEVRKYFPNGTQNSFQIIKRVDEFLSYYDKKGLPTFTVFELDTGEFVGRAGFAEYQKEKTQVGYVLHKKFWGMGYATELLETLLDWANSHIDADYIYAFAMTEHLASFRVMEKCRMVYQEDSIFMGVSIRIYGIENKLRE